MAKFEQRQRVRYRDQMNCNGAWVDNALKPRLRRERAAGYAKRQRIWRLEVANVSGMYGVLSPNPPQTQTLVPECTGHSAQKNGKGVGCTVLRTVRTVLIYWCWPITGVKIARGTVWISRTVKLLPMFWFGTSRAYGSSLLQSCPTFTEGKVAGMSCVPLCCTMLISPLTVLK